VLIPLREADRRCGAKAANLGRLLRAGFDVPAGFVIADPIGDDGWGREIESALVDLGSGSFAVRSSAFGEDGRQASFAGQLDTTLGATTTAQIVQAARRTPRSGAGPKVTGYAARTGHAAGSLVPVIVQVMVEPEAAGVLFTRHPVSGADEVVIEAAGGLGDKVVDGTVTPRAWTVDGGGITGPGLAEAPVLTRAQVRTLGRIGRRIEAVFDVPQDIEWAVADRRSGSCRPGRSPPAPRRQRRSRPSRARCCCEARRRAPPSPSGRRGSSPDWTTSTSSRPGDVLVCRTTAPAWTPLLARATAVVTEIGGMLAHAAIVDAQAHGWAAYSSFAGKAGWSLTEAGRAQGERLLAAELDGVGARAVVEVYRDFLPLNDVAATACTAWQLAELGIGEQTMTLGETTATLQGPATALAGIEGRLTAHLDRFAGYHHRFTTALSKVGDEPAWITGTDRDSCHRVWFELHEDLIATLGLVR